VLMENVLAVGPNWVYASFSDGVPADKHEKDATAQDTRMKKTVHGYSTH
jgi:hypothetical protein